MTLDQAHRQESRLISLISWPNKARLNRMKQKWNCRPTFSNRNPQLQNTSLRKPELTKSPKLRTMTYSTTMLRCSQFLMCCSTSRLSRLLLRLKRNTSLKKFVSSNMSITRGDNSKILIGSKKSREKSQGSSKRIRLLIMLGRRESSNSIPCRSYSAWILPRPSSLRILKLVCSI